MKNKGWLEPNKLSRILRIIERKKRDGDFISLDGILRTLEEEKEEVPRISGSGWDGISIVKWIMILAGVHYSQKPDQLSLEEWLSRDPPTEEPEERKSNIDLFTDFATSFCGPGHWVRGEPETSGDIMRRCTACLGTGMPIKYNNICGGCGGSGEVRDDG